jgi:hypothetical protein
MRDLSKRLRGGNVRHAVEAVAALRRVDPATGAGLVPSIDTKDEQRAFQLLVARLVAEGGVHGLAARWRDLPSPQWREMLVSEIGQAFHRWVEEGTVDLLLAALEDPDDKVARRAVKLLTSCLREVRSRGTRFRKPAEAYGDLRREEGHPARYVGCSRLVRTHRPPRPQGAGGRPRAHSTTVITPRRCR